MLPAIPRSQPQLQAGSVQHAPLFSRIHARVKRREDCPASINQTVYYYARINVPFFSSSMYALPSAPLLCTAQIPLRALRTHVNA